MLSKPKIDLARYRKPVVELHGVFEFESASLQPEALYTMPLGEGQLDVLVELKPGKPMVVFFGGAVVMTPDRTLPSLSGLGILTGHDVSKVLIGDPALYLDERLNLAWYLGADGIDAQEGIVRILKKIECAAAPAKTLCIGGSGGGFAAMQYAANFQDWLAVAWNPQTDIFCYKPDAVKRYLRMAWGIDDIPTGREKLKGKIQTDLFSTYSGACNDAFAIYLQNQADDHVETHLKPFLVRRGVTALDSGMVGHRCYLQMANFGEGHANPPKGYLTALLNGLMKDSRPWEDMFGKGLVAEVLGTASLTLGS